MSPFHAPATLLATLDAYALNAAERGVAEQLVVLGGGSHRTMTPTTGELAAGADCAHATAARAKRTLIGLGVVQAVTAPGSVDLLWITSPQLWHPPALLGAARAAQLPLPERTGAVHRGEATGGPV